ILETTGRAGRLIDQLLSFARRDPLRREVFCVKSRVEDFRSIIETTVGSKRKLVFNFADGLSPVDTDAGQFETAILNLLINARDATPQGGAITISAYNEGLAWLYADGRTEKRRCTAIGVADTGTGIEPDVVNKIFDACFTTKEDGKGTGLGLSLVEGFAKQSGGDITVDSKPG